MSRRKLRKPGERNPTDVVASRDAVGIVRVSTTKQSDGMSPEVQKNGIEEYARSVGLKVEIRKVFESGKESGDARPQFQAALAEARARGNVIFWVWDRSGRNLTDHEQLEKEVRAGKLQVHIALDRRVYNHKTPETDWFAAGLHKLTHKQYSFDLSRRALEGMSAKAEAGEYPAKPPLGYIIAPKTGPEGEAVRRGGKIVKLPWCDALFLRMLQLKLSGASLKVIATTVVSENLVPAHKRAPFEQAAAAAKVDMLLKNPFYSGSFEWNGRHYPGTHEAVFSAAQWEALQASVQSKPAALRTVKREAALAGFLKCAQCGCQITYDPKKRGERVYHYYRCANGKKQHSKLVYVSEADILEGFASAAEAIAIDIFIADELKDILSRSHVEVRAQRKRDSDRFRRELAALEPLEDQLTDMLMADSIDDAAYKRKLARIREQRADLAQKLEQGSERLDDAHMETVRSTLELAKRAKLQWAERSAVEKRRFLELVLSNAQLDGESVRYTLRKPFAILAEMRGSADWRTRAEEFRTAIASAA